MSLYFVFTIDGDWEEYFDSKLSIGRRMPQKKQQLVVIDRQIKLAHDLLNGKFLYFVHSSPLVRDFFLKPGFIAKWKELEAGGGDVGVHCHEEELYQKFYFADVGRMETAINFLTEALSRNGLQPKAYRGGHLAFSHKIIPILEQNELFLDFSSDSGRHLFYNNNLVADWRGAPSNYYCMSYEDHCKEGDSKVFEIPLGIYIEKQSLFSIWRKAKKLSQSKTKQIVSVLAHNYDFTTWQMRLKIKFALIILKKYGTFINVTEALPLVKGE